MSPNTPTLGNLIAQQRATLGLTMQVVADQVGVSKAMVHHWERGAKTPAAGNLSRLASVLQLDFEELFVTAGYAPEGLPTLQPYLRTKYAGASQQALAEAEAFFAAWEQQHGTKEQS